MAAERLLAAEVSPSFGAGHWAGYHRVETERAKGLWQHAVGVTVSVIGSIRNGASEANDWQDFSPYVLLDHAEMLADNWRT